MKIYKCSARHATADNPIAHRLKSNNQATTPTNHRGFNKKKIQGVTKMAKTYQQFKAQAREQAIEWQNDFNNHNYHQSELAEQAKHFEKLGKRYGLLKEFKENGIC